MNIKKILAVISAAAVGMMTVPFYAFAADDVVEINEANFPDAVFREYVQQFDTDGVSGLSQAELDAVTEINVSGTSESPNTIEDLSGIEYFTKLTNLNFQFNQVSSIDLSKNTALTNLICDHNKFTELDLTNNKALELIWCGENEFTSLDFSPNTALKQIVCRNNPNLTSVKVSSNANLEWFDCGNSPINSLDVSNNTALKDLICDRINLTSLDVSNNTALTTLNCDNNTYSIGEVTDSYSLSNLPKGFDPSKATNWTGATYDEENNCLKDFTSTEVTYTYDCGNGKTALFTLNALSIPASKDVASISVTAPDKTIYAVGDTLDVTGGKVIVAYSDGSTNSIDLTADMVTGFDSTTTGSKTLTVTYEGKTTTYDIEVKNPEMLRVEVKTDKVIVEYSIPGSEKTRTEEYSFNDVTEEIVDFMKSKDIQLLIDFVNNFSTDEEMLMLSSAQLKAIEYVLEYDYSR